MKFKFLALILLGFLLSSCAPSEEQLAPIVEKTVSAWATQTAYPSLTPMNTFTPYPTYTPNATYTPVHTSTAIIQVVTATYTATPKFTATITLTPSPTIPPTPTMSPLKTTRGAGIYLVGVDIAPGVWRNNGKSESCYWKVSSKTGSIISNHFGLAGGTAYVPATGYQVEFNKECGAWIWLSE